MELQRFSGPEASTSSRCSAQTKARRAQPMPDSCSASPKLACLWLRNWFDFFQYFFRPENGDSAREWKLAAEGLIRQLWAAVAPKRRRAEQNGGRIRAQRHRNRVLSECSSTRGSQKKGRKIFEKLLKKYFENWKWFSEKNFFKSFFQNFFWQFFF